MDTHITVGKKKDTDYLFEVDGFKGDLKTQKEMWKEVVLEANCFEPERYKMHGTRKGFATALMRKGIQQSLISFAGRWAILGAINRYIHHVQEELLTLAKVILYGRDQNQKILDLDQEEMMAISKMDQKTTSIDSNSFNNTDAIHEIKIVKKIGIRRRGFNWKKT